MLEHWYSLYGLTLRSEIPLHAPAAAPGRADLHVVASAPREVPAQPAAGDLLCQFEYPGGGSAHARTADGYVLRYYGTAEFEMDAGLARVTAHSDPRCIPDMACELLIASVPAFRLLLSGRAVLHASAVARDGAALGLMAHSGGGKSTLAATLCARGCTALTDDVLTLDWRGESPWVQLGPAEIRLRPSSVTLVPRLPHTRATVDGRVAVQAPAPRAPARLAALVTAQIDNTATNASLERLSAGDALAAVLGHLRTVGWKDAPVLSRIFAEQARLASAVPAYRLTLPWGAEGLAGASALLLKLL